jgi:hypothetical protein
MYLYFINVLTLINICHSSIEAGSDKTTVGHNPTIVAHVLRVKSGCISSLYTSHLISQLQLQASNSTYPEKYKSSRICIL